MYRRWPEVWTAQPLEQPIGQRKPFWTDDRKETVQMVLSMIVVGPLILIGYALAVGLLVGLVAVFVFGLQALGGS